MAGPGGDADRQRVIVGLNEGGGEYRARRVGTRDLPRVDRELLSGWGVSLA